MKKEVVQSYFNQKDVVKEYSDAALNTGLWASEEVIFTEAFPDKQLNLLELGTGAGRIALGLWDLGYSHITAIDYCPEMIDSALKNNELRNAKIDFRLADATDLDFLNNTFDAAIFGFNGLMQIPGRRKRLRAMLEAFRVLKPGSFFTFTTHDREAPDCDYEDRKQFWIEEAEIWEKGEQYYLLEDFGDIYYRTPHGNLFIHIPTCDTIIEDIEKVGFRFIKNPLRSEMFEESKAVQDFSDNCRLWVVQKPETS